ncbi:MAG TPA: NRDE family protein [Jatrophihabitans sp.]|nr:NRDE family protein [Jatrophihabitans sp.]
MCTLVCRWAPDEVGGIRMLALRDERASRSFDLPGSWWPDQPQVVGGRDRLGGGTWCAVDVATGVSAVVLNRPDRRLAAAGAPSRGVLPLLAVRRLADWPSDIELTGMASFNLVLATPSTLAWWRYDGDTLAGAELASGTHLFTPRGLADGALADRFASAVLPAFIADDAPTEAAWSDWLAIVRESEPSADPLDLLVRIPIGTDTFETVFGQFIASRPGALRLDYVRTPADGRPWTVQRWTADDVLAGPRA